MMLRAYPHKPDESTLRVLRLAATKMALKAETRRERALEKADAYFFGELATTHLVAAALTYAFVGDEQPVRDHLRGAAEAGILSLSLNHQSNPWDFRDWLTCTIIVGATSQRSRLIRAPETAWRDISVQPETALVVQIRCLSQLANGDNAVDVLLDALLERSKPANLPPELRELPEDMLGTAQLIQAVSHRDQQVLDDLFRARTDRWASHFSRVNSIAPAALLDLCGLAIIGLAARRSLKVSVDSVYLPHALLAMDSA